MNASIIIPVYKRTGWITKCIESLNKQDYDGLFEVIIVDDGSPNESEVKESIIKISGQNRFKIKCLRNYHSGPAATRNYGVKYSSGRILCFIDDDSLPECSWLREIAGSFDGDECPDIVSGKILSYNREDKLPLMLEKALYSGKHWATCNIAYRRDVFDALGGFDETFIEASWEDNDLGLRARWSGYKYVYNEKAVVYHNHESTLEEYKKKCILNGRGAAAFSRKYILKKPLWGIATPFIMSRRLIYGFLPSVWRKDPGEEAYLRFIWSFYSLKGFFESKKKMKLI